MRRLNVLAVLALVALLAIGIGGVATALQVGDKAPDFTLPATTSEKFSLNQFAGKNHVVLFGFIGAFTPT